MDDTELAEGTEFGQYRVVGRLGAGAMGAVYKAVHTGLDKLVVLKVLHARYAQSPNIRQRFAREGRAAAAIRHPHVVDVTDVGEHQGTPYLIMELLDGESLGDLLERLGALSPDSAVDLMLPIIAGVDAAHAAGVVHRDLKPDNIFVTRDATGAAHPKVLDFGISRVVAGDTGRRTDTTATLGTPAYMAPEQLASSRDADAKSDQYALGVILYECVTGALAFEADNIYKLFRLVGEGTFRRPREVRPELPAELEAIVLRAMSLSPEARFPSLQAFSTALLPFASERAKMLWGGVASVSGAARSAGPLPAPKPAPPSPSPDTLNDAAGAHDTVNEGARRRNRIVWLTAAVTAMLVGGAVVARGGGAPTNPAQPRAVVVSPQPPVASPVVAQPAPAIVATADAQVAATPVVHVEAPSAPAAHARSRATHATTRHAAASTSLVAVPAVVGTAPAQPRCTGPDCQHPVE